MKKRWLLAPIVAVPLAITSPVTCSCEPDPSTLAGQMGIYHLPSEEPTTVKRSEELARMAFTGKKLNQLTQSGSIDSECHQNSPSVLQCEYWTDNSILYSKGRSVRIELDKAGKVLITRVKESQRIMLFSFGSDG